ncbi:MAG: hypothetical protein R3B49_03310 [Phycisphaerales bacterium]
MRTVHASVLVVLAAAHTAAVAQTDLLPDIKVDEQRLYDNYQSGNTLRLSNGTANVGEGKFYIYGADNGDGTQEVWQRIFRTDGSFYDILASNFIYHPHPRAHPRRELGQLPPPRDPPGDGVGPIVAERGAKTPFCILGTSSSTTLTSPTPTPTGSSSAAPRRPRGSPSDGDVHSSGLDGQSIDITGVPEGEYWFGVRRRPRQQLHRA